MNRRAFLQRFGIGLGAACALAAIPVAVVETFTIDDAGRRLACEFLRRQWNAVHTGPITPLKFSHTIHVSQGLYDAFNGELMANERFHPDWRGDGSPPPALMFKAARVIAHPDIATWEGLRFVA